MKPEHNKATLFVGGLIIILSCVCCVSTRQSVDFSLDNVDSVFVEQYLRLNQIELAGIGPIVFWQQDQVIVADGELPSLLSLIDLGTGRKKPFLKMGGGPGECLGIQNLTVKNKILYAYSLASKKMIALQEAVDTSLVFSLVNDIPIKEECLRLIPSPECGFVGTPRKGPRFYSFSETGEVNGSFGSFPNVNGEPDAINNMSLQSEISFSPDGMYFCSPFLMVDYIEIYSDNYSKIRRLWGPEPFVPQVERVSDGLASYYSQKPPKDVFRTLSVSDKGFLVGYIGHLNTSRDEPVKTTRELLYFSWNGDLIRRYILPEQLAYFDVDWENGRMCGITFEVEPKLVQAKLDGI